MRAGRRLQHAFVLAGIAVIAVVSPVVGLVGPTGSAAPEAPADRPVAAARIGLVRSEPQPGQAASTILLATTDRVDRTPPAAAVGQRLERVVVANTDGQGANLRATPGRGGAVLRVLAEGETLAVAGPSRMADAIAWRPVRDAAGHEGWVAATLLQPAGAPTTVGRGRPVGVPSPTAMPDTTRSIDTRLLSAWHSLAALDPFGPVFDEVVARSGARVTVGPLSPNVYGAFRPRLNAVTINQSALAEDPRAVATVLAHELTHARQVFEGLGHEADDCVAMEVEAFQVSAEVWSAFWPASAPARTALERGLNSVTRLWQTDGPAGLRGYVVETPGYQHQCGI